MIKPFSKYALVMFFWLVFRPLIPGTEALSSGQEVELWLSYVSGAILLGTGNPVLTPVLLEKTHQLCNNEVIDLDQGELTHQA